LGRVGPVNRGLEVAQRLLALLGQHDLQHILDVRNLRHTALAHEQLRGDRAVAGLGEAPGAVLDVLVDAPDLRDDQEDRVILAGGGAGLVHGDLDASDRDLLIASDETVRIRLDRLGQHRLDAERVPGDRAPGDQHLTTSHACFGRSRH
jgi:hypothetical protein